MASFKSFDGKVIDYVYFQGRGPALVFFPALGFDYTYWSRSIQHFHSKGWAVLGITLRGQSTSRYWKKAIFMQDHLKDVKALLSQLKIKGAILVGASFGGVVAAYIAQQVRVKKCVCINTPFEGTRDIRFYVRLLAFLSSPLAFLDFFNRGKACIDFSKSKITNNIIMMLKAIFKFNSYGIFLNYACLLANPVSPSGCIIVRSRNDEAVAQGGKADYVINGNHNCAISRPDEINSIIEKVTGLLH